MSDEMKERVARAWASIDGKLDKYERCREAPTFEYEIELGGYYNGYLADAEALIKRSGIGDRIAELEAEVERLRGGEADTLSDQKRARLFQGTALDYVRQRACKHETHYADPQQAAHLRRLATETEERIEALEAEVERHRDNLHAIQNRASLVARMTAQGANPNDTADYAQGLLDMITAALDRHSSALRREHVT